MFVEQENEIRGCGAEMTAALFQRLSAVSVGKQSEVPDLYETGGNTWRRKRRMNSAASSLMTLLRLLCRESRQRKRT
jgi:hypothetical protein